MIAAMERIQKPACGESSGELGLTGWLVICCNEGQSCPANMLVTKHRRIFATQFALFRTERYYSNQAEGLNRQCDSLSKDGLSLEARNGQVSNPRKFSGWQSSGAAR